MISGLEMKAWDAGLALGLAALATLLISPIAGNASDRFGAEKLCMVGALFTGVGYILLLMLNAESTVVMILPAMLLIGSGTGLFFSPNNNLMLASAPPERAGMVSGLFGVLRQSGYALGFAITASLFTAIQNWFDLQWAYSSINTMEKTSALSITDIYHQGSQWSPEILVFILHIGVLLCTSILIITFINSLPKIKLTFNRHLSIVITSACIALLSMGVYSMQAPGYFVYKAPTVTNNQKSNKVIAFGMASRNLDFEIEATDSPIDSKLVEDRSQSGLENYMKRCVFCHGKNLEGVASLGVSLQDSDFVSESSLDELIEMLKLGRMPNSEKSISGGVMPGFSWLSESELKEIAYYVQSVNSAYEDK